MSAGWADERLRSLEDSLRPFTVPNLVTLVRMALVPFMVLAVSDADYRLALLLFVAAGATDSLDGFLARRFSMSSRIGAYLDPIADKILLTTAYVVLTIDHGQEVVIPLWLTILALFRDGLIVTVALALYLVEDVRSFRPSIWGKLTTLLHVVTVATVLTANVVRLPVWVPLACFYLSFALVLLSGFDYIVRVGRMVDRAPPPSP